MTIQAIAVFGLGDKRGILFLLFLAGERFFYCGFLAGLEREDIVRVLVFGGFSVEFAKEVALSCIDLSGEKNKCCKEEEEENGSNQEQEDIIDISVFRMLQDKERE